MRMPLSNRCPDRSVIGVLRHGVACLCVTVGIMILFQGSLSAEPLTASAELFTVQCAGCHPHGGNIIRRGQTLKMKALKRNHLDSVAAIATLVTEGKNNMSAYGDQLTDAEITAVSTYVWEQAQHNWH